MAEAVLLLPSHTEQYKSSKRDFQEFLDQISGKLLEFCGDLCVCLFFCLNILYQPMKKHVIVVAVCHQGIPQCQWRKASLMSTKIHCSD